MDFHIIKSLCLNHILLFSDFTVIPETLDCLINFMPVS